MKKRVPHTDLRLDSDLFVQRDSIDESLRLGLARDFNFGVAPNDHEMTMHSPHIPLCYLLQCSLRVACIVERSFTPLLYLGTLGVLSVYLNNCTVESSVVFWEVLFPARTYEA